MEREVILAESRILIVDDQDANVLLCERLLQQAGYQHYRSLTDSRLLLDQFRLFQPDLILLDLMMPRLDGYAVMKQLAGWLPSDVYFPILVITADVSRNARQKALGLGAKDFLTKPIDAVEALLRIYNLLLTRWLYRQMESRQMHFAAQAGEWKSSLDGALAELQQPAPNLAGLRGRLRALRAAASQLAADSLAAPAGAAAG